MLVRETREPPHNFLPTFIRRRQLFELVERRNEWTDWHGSTDVITRGSNYAETTDVDTKDAMKARAEKRRKQGSKFIIRVIPVLLLENDSHCLMVGQKYTDKPLHGLMKHPGLQNFDTLKWRFIFDEVMAFVLSARAGVILVPKDRSEIAKLEPFDEDEPCFNFESVASPKAASLGWSSCGRIATDEFHAFMAAFKQKRELGNKRRLAQAKLKVTV